MVTWFWDLNTKIRRKAINRKGVNPAKPPILDTIVFSTDYNLLLDRGALAQLLYPIPIWTSHNPYLDTSKVTIAFRINNRLGAIFSHDEHNKKVTRLLLEEQQNN